MLVIHFQMAKWKTFNLVFCIIFDKQI